jgi:hypothetical protein
LIHIDFSSRQVGLGASDFQAPSRNGCGLSPKKGNGDLIVTIVSVTPTAFLEDF